MPSSTAALVYGRQGNRWLPDKPARRRPAPTDAPPARACTHRHPDGQPCRVAVDQHQLCRACGLPVEHHDEHTVDDCWAGLARIALSLRNARLPLSVLDEEALRRCPNPPSSFHPGEPFPCRP